MISMYLSLAAFAFLLSLVLAAVGRKVALRLGMVDAPDGRRKTHQGEIPLAGGLAVAAAIPSVLAVYAALFPELRLAMGEGGRYLLALAFAGTMIFIVGLFDDRYGLRGRQKLLGQVAAVAVFWAISDLSFHKLGLFGLEIDLGILAIPFTLFWLLGAINAVNLLDGIDGLAGTVGAIAAFALAGMCLINDRAVDAALALALGGALVGFLRYNIPPATMFLGDTGSMLIGFLLGALALHSSLKGPATVALAAPIAMLAIPIVDSTAAILRRKLTGRSIYSTDRGHMHHVIMGKGFSNLATVAIIGLASTVTCSAALASVYWKNELFAAMSVVVVVSTMVATRVFGYSEFLLVRNRMLEFGRSLVRPVHREPQHRQRSLRIQGSRDWERLWNQAKGTLAEFVLRVRLDLDVPQLHEGFHAFWERSCDWEETHIHRQSLPIVAHGKVVGRLEVMTLLGEEIDVEESQGEANRLLALVQMGAATLLDDSTVAWPAHAVAVN